MFAVPVILSTTKITNTRAVQPGADDDVFLIEFLIFVFVADTQVGHTSAVCVFIYV